VGIFFGATMKKEYKFLPEGYRYLKVGEPLQVNDYYWNKTKSMWSKITHLSPISNWVKEHVIREDKQSCLESEQ